MGSIHLPSQWLSRLNYIWFFLKGRDGINGRKGTRGDRGTQGVPGQPGGTGSIGPQGNAGPSGDDGPPGPPGPEGIKVAIISDRDWTMDIHNETFHHLDHHTVQRLVSFLYAI